MKITGLTTRRLDIPLKRPHKMSFTNLEMVNYGLVHRLGAVPPPR